MRRHLALVLLAAALGALGLRLFAGTEATSGAVAPGLHPPPAPGEAAPRFELQDPRAPAGTSVAVGGPSASWTILTFFRKAGTPW